MAVLFESADWPGARALEGGRVPVGAWENLQPLLTMLPDAERVVMMLRFRDGVPQSCIAARMGVEPEQVERMLGTALARLRDQI
jgi:DNA-directed RNA polymerase specialized sigma subunit